MNQFKKIKARLIEENQPFYPSITWEEIEQFEQKNGILLPKAYRNFLAEVADGGIMVDGNPLLQLSELQVNPQNLQKEFPFTSHWLWEEDSSPFSYEQVTHGNIALIDLGDCQTWNLIVSGACAGEMWFFTDVGIQPACPRRDFISWLQYYLDGGEDYFSGFIG